MCVCGGGGGVRGCLCCWWDFFVVFGLVFGGFLLLLFDFFVVVLCTGIYQQLKSIWKLSSSEKLNDSLGVTTNQIGSLYHWAVLYPNF